MQLIAKTDNGIITVFNLENQIIGSLEINFKTKQHQIVIPDKTYQITQEKWLSKVIENNQTIYHLKTDKFWGTIKIEELDKQIRGVFGQEWGSQLRDSDKKTLLKIKNEHKWKNTGNYILQIDEKNVTSLEILLTLYGHIVGSIAKQNIILYT